MQLAAGKSATLLKKSTGTVTAAHRYTAWDSVGVTRFSCGAALAVAGMYLKKVLDGPPPTE